MPFDLEFVRQSWPHPVSYFATIDSTMHEASRLAAAGCEHGTVVIADEQTEGQGRHGRHWHSEPNAGLYVSIVLLPSLRGDALPVLTLALGLATADAIAEVTGLTCDLRWPNDVMLEGKKVAGILVQLVDFTAIAGIGVNVSHTAFPPELAAEATSLRIVSSRPHSREQLLVALLGAVSRYCGVLEGSSGRDAILHMFSRRSSYARNKRVTVEQGTSTLEGTTAGLDPSGFLIVRKDDGTESLVLAGGVRPAEKGARF
ncbi:MAG: biotin--[acetyl-CoA-carboxylase] ligase [Acidobacteriia bacterium]|nr:biotin--[acetyl-CoA-carboxylase] ligase [Terriglobia bacterium]